MASGLTSSSDESEVNSNVKVVDLRIMNGLKLHDIQGGRSYRLGVHGASASSLSPQLSPRQRHLFSGQSQCRSGSNHPPVLRIKGLSLPVSEYKPGYLSYGITVYDTLLDRGLWSLVRLGVTVRGRMLKV